MVYVVTLRRGGPWDWSVEMREQDGFEEHSRYMDALVDEAFVLLGGPLASEREVLLIVEAVSEAEVHDRLAADVWGQDGRLTIESIEPWTILLDGLGLRSRHML
jgi:hypothetical protein